MFLETPVANPETRVGRELAEAMRRGMVVVKPGDGYGSGDPTFGCALCCLATGLGERVGIPLHDTGSGRARLNARFGKALINEIEFRYEGWHSKRYSFEEIADWLDSL
jgi:hypothetical protein